jgi:DNA-binding LytR/AlgR family response regulator
MNSPRILIAEDEPLLRQEMQRLVALHWPQAVVVAVAQDGEQALELWAQHQPNVLFLDIQMPGTSGLLVAQHISTQAGTNAHFPQIVFVTAYDQHALAAFEAGAVDYLLKPVKPERMQAVVAKLKRALAANTSQPTSMSPALLEVLAQLAQTVKPVRSQQPLQWISASLGQHIKLVNVADIVYFQSDSKYTRIVTAAGEALVRKSLKELLDDIGSDNFQQVHRSTVVNMQQVSGVTKDGTGKGEVKFRLVADVVDVSAAFMGVFKPV